jgi:hypothetical protein
MVNEVQTSIIILGNSLDFADRVADRLAWICCGEPGTMTLKLRMGIISLIGQS